MTPWKRLDTEPPSLVFLEELRERARCYGWTGDYEELHRFIAHLYEQAGLPVPDLEPYAVDE